MGFSMDRPKANLTGSGRTVPPASGPEAGPKEGADLDRPDVPGGRTAPRPGFAAAWTSVVLAMALARPCAAGGSPFAADARSRVPVLCAGAVVFSVGNWAQSRPLSVERKNLDARLIFPPDRFAVRCSSGFAARVSDGAAAAAALLPLFVSNRGDRAGDLLTAFEAQMLSQGASRLCKGWFRRPRPYAYRWDPSRGPLPDDAFRSFFSGHTAAAFCGAVTAGVLCSARDPRGPACGRVWTLGLSLAAGAGACRVLGGRHFPTDVAAGAAAGALFGWLVPQLHRER